MPKARAAAAALFLLACACKDAGSSSAPGSGAPKPSAAGESGVARATAASKGAPATAEISVTEKGFEPARIEVAAGEPVLLRFTRKVEATCADAVEVQGDPVRHLLPLNRSVEVKVTPPASGQLAFACPMKMIRGALVVLPH